MIYSLRCCHFFIWIFLAILLPFGFAISWIAIPNDVQKEANIDKQSSGKSVVLGNVPWAKVIQIQQGTQFDLEVEIKQPLMVPGTVLYIGKSASSTIKESIILGSIESLGRHKFSIDHSISSKGNYLLFYDPFNEKVTHHIAI